jgi:alkylresorcinol/alkylpyrone synthase
VLLASALGLPRTVARTPLHHLGCLGGFRALAVAADIARGDPSARVLVVYGDVSSLIGASLQSPMNEADLLSIAIFTDGAAAAVVGGSGPARGAQAGAAGAPPLARLAASRSGLIRAPDGAPTADQMWLRESGFRPDGSIIGENFVGKGVPKHLLRSLAPFVEELLADYEAAAARAAGSESGGDDAAAERERFAPPLASLPVLCHPGGPAVLDTVTRALRLAPWQLAHSWAVLSGRGNMSGATNLFVLHDFLTGGARLPDGSRATHAMGLAFGPGLAVEGLLLEVL